nr:hypothetical protein [Tanacetum cinerariifolium]
MVEKSKLDEDLQGKPVDATLYYGMIGSLMYLTSRASGEWNYGTLLFWTEYQLADIFTKPLPIERFNFLIEKLESRLPSLLNKPNLIWNLFPRRKDLKLEKFNERLNPGKKQREPTFHVVLDALALTPCYSAFLITLDVPEVYMHQLSTIPGSLDEPTRKSKRVKRPTKKSFDALTIGIVIRETPVKSLSKKKAKMNVEKCKGIDMLSEMALTKEAQYEEVLKKSLRDFYKTHLSGFGTVTKIAPSVAKIKPSVTNEGTGTKPRVPDVTKEEATESEGLDSKHETDKNESGSKSNQEENKEEIKDNKEEEEDEFVKTLSNDTDDEKETKITDKDEGDKDEGIDYTTNQIDDDVDLRINEPVTNDEGFIQKEDQEENLGNDDEEPKRKVASKRDWFTKPPQSQEPTDLDWNVGKAPHQGPTQRWLMTLVSSADKPSKTF